MIFKYSILVILSLIFALILVLIIRKHKPSYFGQVLTHTLLYFIEIIAVTTFINYIIGKDALNDPNSSLIEVIRNYVFAFTFYQLLLLMTFKLKDSLDTDSFTALKNLVDKYQLFAEFKKKIPVEELEKVRVVLKDSSLTFNNEQRKNLIELITITDIYNHDKMSTEDFRFTLKQLSREFDFRLKYLSYSWMNSLLLRWFK